MVDAGMLQSVTWTCVHFAGADDMRAERPRLERVLVLDAVFDESRPLLRTLGDALRFPDYFGGNWDAFNECVRDMEWLPAQGYVLVVWNAAELWAQHVSDAGILVELWLGAAEVWAGQGTPFHLVFVMQGEG